MQQLHEKSGHQLATLLIAAPHRIKECEPYLHKLNNLNWVYLVHCQPQFKTYSELFQL